MRVNIDISQIQKVVQMLVEEEGQESVVITPDQYIDLLKFLFDKIVSVNLSDLEKFIGLIKKVKDRMNPKEYNSFIEENLSDVIEELPILEKYKSRFQ